MFSFGRVQMRADNIETIRLWLTMTKMSRPSLEFLANARLRAILEAQRMCATLTRLNTPTLQKLSPGMPLISSPFFFLSRCPCVAHKKTALSDWWKRLLKTIPHRPPVWDEPAAFPHALLKTTTLLRRVAARKGTIMHFGIRNSPLWKPQLPGAVLSEQKKVQRVLTHKAVQATHFDYTANSNTHVRSTTQKVLGQWITPVSCCITPCMINC